MTETNKDMAENAPKCSDDFFLDCDVSDVDKFDLKFTNVLSSVQRVDAIRISLASPETIRAMSYGEVTKPETVNYRTSKPEPNGLFCARIFGTNKNYECMCGKYKKIKNRGTICEKCHVEVTDASVRRERMGHINLNAPVVHVWYLRSLPSKVGTLLDLPLKNLISVLYFHSHIVVDPGVTALINGQLLSEEELMAANKTYGSGSFVAMIGANAIKHMLSSLSLEDLSERLRVEFRAATSEMKRRKLLKRLRLVLDFLQSKNKPEWMVLDALPVIPPDVRPLVVLEGGRFASSDLNELYRRVINRNNRYKRLVQLGAPSIIVRNEHRMLQESVDALLDGSKKTQKSFLPNSTASGNRAKRSLSESLKGKQGRLRQHLLGKRADYSARSVIASCPGLSLYQCGLPRQIAREIFKPYIFYKLQSYGISVTIKSAKRMVDNERPEIWDVLEEVVLWHPVLLNRAPTLHRLGIQAFFPKLVDGKAIGLHPLVCSAFNADFDGDQMAIHVPLSVEAQIEAIILIMSVNNLLNPSNGRPTIVPSKDLVLGIYYASLRRAPDSKYTKKIIGSMPELTHAMESGLLHQHSTIMYAIEVQDKESDKTRIELRETTPGRVMIFDLLPKHKDLTFDVVNKIMGAKEIMDLFDRVYRACGPDVTAKFSDRMMGAGFEYATKSGISFGKDDMVIPKHKWQYIDDARQEVVRLESQFQDGLITASEKHIKVIDVWTECNDKVGHDMIKEISANMRPDDTIETNGELNSIFMMAHSGARGSPAQMRQLGGMRGLMTTPSGEIIELPILSNLREGLSVQEFFISTHGARKGLSDTALKTANSGYLNRRLVDMAQDCVVCGHDCGGDDGLFVGAVVGGGEITVEMSDIILGRVVAEDVIDDSGVVIAKTNKLIDEALAAKISTSGLETIKIRSPLTCSLRHGICALCYGRDLATGSLVSIGAAVGVVAAQSIGEPGTQLTMRTFHIGGASTRKVEVSVVEARIDCTVKVTGLLYVIDKTGQKIVTSRTCEITAFDAEQKKICGKYKVVYGAKIFVSDGEFVQARRVMVSWDPYYSLIIAEEEGVARYSDLINGVSYTNLSDSVTGMVSKVVCDWSSRARVQSHRPGIRIENSTTNELSDNPQTGARNCYYLSIGSIIMVEDGAEIHVGDVIARSPREAVRTTTDITGGLPKVSDLFEARHPKNKCILSEMDGIVRFGKEHRLRRRIIIQSHDGGSTTEYLVTKGKHILVESGDLVRKGDPLTDGEKDMHDILRILGLREMASYLLQEIQRIYRFQGVTISDKHIEIIVRQMTRRVEIVDAGDTSHLAGELLGYDESKVIIKSCIEKGIKPPIVIPKLLGITKAAVKNNSFLAASAFQEAVKVLGDAAVAGKVDPLRGLKENVVVGRCIPAGTGFIMQQYRKKAAQFIVEEGAT